MEDKRHDDNVNSAVVFQDNRVRSRPTLYIKWHKNDPCGALSTPAMSAREVSPSKRSHGTNMSSSLQKSVYKENWHTQHWLSYSGKKCYRIPEALGQLYGHKVQCLDLSYNEIVTLKGLEAFPQLEELILDNNQLTDSLVFPSIPQLHTLSLNKNLITDIEGLIIKIVQNFPSITYLSLLGNQACPNQLTNLENDDADYQRYRYFVLHHLPTLKFLDSTRVHDVERAEARRRGQFMKVVRPKVNNLSQPDILQDRDSSSLNRYTPLPSTLRKFNEHKGAYGKCRYKYSGKHSEGNRFISNNDL